MPWNRRRWAKAKASDPLAASRSLCESATFGATVARSAAKRLCRVRLASSQPCAELRELVPRILGLRRRSSSQSDFATVNAKPRVGFPRIRAVVDQLRAVPNKLVGLSAYRAVGVSPASARPSEPLRYRIVG